ncbi:usg protein [Chelativorans sp. Marseille-P2723]|uniref:usg protein n=1 Tax=Chelativorans sp. Marseille-P2723 TaxID=2709133 RepID=UPI00156E46C4|nr:usg protein [Chelativorans sp. Marseille-P2723]
MHTTSETELMLKGYGLTTAKFLYHLPDHPHLLQSFVWQLYDVAPEFPALYRFIDFWRDTLDGPLHSVRFTHRRLVAPSEWRNVTGELVLH